jgi:multidrug efflux system membrane fusion protein
MYGTATLTFGEQADALLVREEAIGADQGQRFVLALGADNSVQYRPVTLGARADGLRVVTSGLKPEDRIVVDGLYRLRPGAIVAPRNVPMQTAASEAGASRQSQES